MNIDRVGRAARTLAFNTLGVGFLIITMYLLLNDPNWSSAGRGAVAILAATLCVLVGNLQHFESIKAWVNGVFSLEAKIREALDDAKATVASLHQLATMTGAFLVDNIAASGRLGGQGTNQQKDEAKSRLLERLKAMGLNDDALLEVSHADRHWVLMDYVHGIFVLPLNQPGWSKLSAEDSVALRDLMELLEPATPEQCEKMLERLNIDDAFAIELLEDYRHYVRTSEHRRPAVWQDRGSWGLRPEVKTGGVYL